MSVRIEATIDLPSKKKLWLLKLRGINMDRFCGKRGTILKNKEQDYWRARHYLNDNQFIISPLDKEEYLFHFDKIKELNMTQEDISFMFRFFTQDFGSKTLLGVEQEIKKELDLCIKNIEKSKKAKILLNNLHKEIKKYIKEEKERG